MSYILQLENDDFGYAVTTWDDHVAIGNPDFNLYTSSNGLTHTGSVDVYKYNPNIDKHVYISTLYKRVLDTDILLAAETGSGDPVSGSFVSGNLHTEADSFTNRSPLTADLDLRLDEGNYIRYLDDAYGQSVDIWNNILVVGCKYFDAMVTIESFSQSYSGSSVDIYDVDKLESSPYKVPRFLGGHNTVLSGGYIYQTASIPPGYDIVEVLFSDVIGPPVSSWSLIDIVPAPRNGGDIYYGLSTSGPSGFLYYRCNFDTNPFLTSIQNPEPDVTSSFGHAVAVNENWIAVSSIESGSSKGAVYLYEKSQNYTFNDTYRSFNSWSLKQVITGSDCLPGDQFGYDIDLNKASGSYSGSIIIGTNRASSSRAYLFEYSESMWRETYIFDPIHSQQYLTFYNFLPLYSGSSVNLADGFGKSVAIWKDTFVVGAPTDRYIYEYSGSSLYRQGSAYIFERCSPLGNDGVKLSLKTYGHNLTLKNNRMGQSVDVYEDKVIVGVPKLNAMTSCYIQGSLYTRAAFTDDQESQINGQILYIQKNSSSMEWDIVNTYQTKKKYLHPYTNYGWDVAVHDKFVVVGAPINLSDSNLYIDLAETESSGVPFGSICGKSYIYNFNNFSNTFYVGNVFYRNGILVINTSGSAFENLFLDNSTPYDYEYDLEYRGKQTVNEIQVICHVEPGEFNVSTNPTSVTSSKSKLFDINENGTFDFQDADVLLKYMQYQNTRFSGNINNNWTSSLLIDDGMTSFYDYYSSKYVGTDHLYSSSFDRIDSTLQSDLDFNQDNKIDLNDMNILWKYFSNRLNQSNYSAYITPVSQRKLYSDIVDFLDDRSGRTSVPLIKSEFGNYESNARLDPTGSFLSTYVTTVGLYSGLDLIAVAKLGNPIKLISDLPYNFVVKLDI